MALPSLAGKTHPPPEAEASPLVRAAELAAAYGPALIILMLPLEFTTRFAHQPLSRWAMVLAAAGLAYLLMLRRRAFALPRQRSAAVLGIFVGVAIVSWLATRAPGSVQPLLDVAAYPVFGLMVMNLVVSREEQRRAWIAFLASGLMVAITGLVLFGTHHAIWTPNPAVANRLNITFADPNITARFLTLCAAGTVILFASRASPAWLCAAAGLACAVVMPLTFSRSGLALFLVSMILAVCVSKERRRAAGIAACIVLAFVAATAINPDTRQRAIDAGSTLVTATTGTAHNMASSTKPADAQDTFALADNRRYLVAAGVTMFLDHPVVGVGFGGYQHQLVTGYRRFIPDLPKPDTVSHTSFVTVAAEMGVTGLLVLIAFLVLVAVEAWRNRRDVFVMAAAMMIVPIVLYSQFEGRFVEEPYLWLFLALFYGALRGKLSLEVGSHTI